MEEIISTISSYVWSAPLVILCLAAGLYFSFGTKFVQVRRFGEMARLLFSTDKTQKTGISSFQAFAMALSGRVGTGNIVGVATAIGYGGPGAIVWMWIIAFLGAGSAFAEATLAQIYKEEHNGQFRGGPSYYIEKGLKCKWLAIIFAVCSVLACGIFLPPVHSNGISTAFSNAFGIDTIYVGIIVAVLIALVIIGGVKRIANVAQIIAPLMAVIYIILSIVVLICNAGNVPSAFKDMITSAFGMNEMLGGILGSTIAWGVKRGIYSNEAGQGTGPIVAAAAKVSHPVKQGLVQAFSVYIDTLLVCTATAVMILATKSFNIYDGDGNLLFVSPIAQLGAPDVSYTSTALGTLVGLNVGKHNNFGSIVLLCFHNRDGLLLLRRNKCRLSFRQRQKGKDCNLVCTNFGHRYGVLRFAPRSQDGVGLGRHRCRLDGLDKCNCHTFAFAKGFQIAQILREAEEARQGTRIPPRRNEH